MLRPEMEPATEFSVLINELVHEFLCHVGKQRSKTIRETETKAVASVVGRAASFTATPSSSEYIQLYNGSNETLVESLDRIQHVATTSLTAV